MQLIVAMDGDSPFFSIRYLAYNAHAASYTWKHLGKVLDMNLTMEENGVIDEREDYAKLNLVRVVLFGSFCSFKRECCVQAKDQKLPVCVLMGLLLLPNQQQPDDFFVPLLHLYFNDDLTEA